MTDNRLDGDVLGAVKGKGEERYVVICNEHRIEEALRAIGRWAANPDLSFNWIDAAQMCCKLCRHEDW